MTHSYSLSLVNHKYFTRVLLVASASALLWGCSGADSNSSAGKSDGLSSQSSSQSSANLDIPFEKITLDNGLDVIFHVDRSDPVVAINLAAHVGSARETKGRTGFAHLFEHLLFLDSENLGYGGLDEMNTRIGGEGTNGFTTNDMTQYFQAVPKDGLEKIIWAEADKLGWFINTVSQNVIDKEKQVVKNEKRQRVDNQPYGHNFSIIGKTLYPEDHPYNWQVIGSLADLDAASLQDTKDFYARWYVPNNVTITLSGDFEISEAKTLIEKYFGEIPRGEDILPYPARAGTLTETRKIMHEDDFATVPRLTMVWPSVEQYHPDSYALDMLMTYLTDGKKAPLVDVLINEQALTSRVAGFHNTAEIAGELYLIMSPNNGEDIDGLLPAIDAGFKRFENNGVSAEDLERIKASAEVDFYGEVQSALGKAIQLSEYNLFANDPGFYKKELAARAAVTPDDLTRVYNKYIKDKPYIATSFVPKGQVDLALEGSVIAKIEEEKIVQGAEKDLSNFDPAARVLEATTPSAFDRTIEPPFGAPVTLKTPEIWRTNLDNGISVFGQKSNETPLIRFSLELTSAGKDRTDLDTLIVPDLLAELMLEGTQTLTAEALEDAIKELGASINVSSTNSATIVSVTTLARNFDATMELVEQIITEPAFDLDEFNIVKRRMRDQFDQAKANPNFIAAREMAKLRYPDTHPFHYVDEGDIEAFDAIDIDDLKEFHANYYSFDKARLAIVGAYDEAAVKSQFSRLETELKTAPAEPETPVINPVDTSKVYLYDIPKAKQSVLSLSQPSLAATDKDYPILDALNYTLGGVYTSKLNSALRVDKGYTYGIRSRFNGAEQSGTFGVNSSVRTNVTYEAIDLIREILNQYGPNMDEAELATLKDALLRGQALESETLQQKLRTLRDIIRFDLPDNFAAKNSEKLQALTLAEAKALLQKYIRPEAMRYVVVGDAATQEDRLKRLGYGQPISLNK